MKTRASSLEDCNYLLKCIALTIYQICLKMLSLAVDKRMKNNLYMHWSILQDKRTKNSLFMHWVSGFYCYLINTQQNFYYFYLYACKTVVLIIIYSSIETTFGFDQMKSLSKQPSIELTRYMYLAACSYALWYIEPHLSAYVSYSFGISVYKA